MTSKIKVDNIENQCGGAVVTKCGGTTTISGTVVKSNTLQASDAGNIISQSGTTITLGANGDNIVLGGTATQTGFGRTGTVDWDTTAKTAGFTGVSGNGYFINTTGGVVTANLPASPSAGDIMSVVDYTGTAATNAITVGRNGSNINGAALDFTIFQNNGSVTLVYVDGTEGWVVTSATTDVVLGSDFVQASGGTETTSGDFKIHSFTGPGSFVVSSAGNPAGSTTVDYLVVAGGGGGGFCVGGGGGAGGFRESPGTASGSYTVSPLGAPPAVALPVTVQGYPITVGSGGAGSNSPPTGCSGSNSIFSTITSAGGGGGGSYSDPGLNGGSGGSGGGGAGYVRLGVGGSGNTPPVSPSQGNNGGSNTIPTTSSSGGGGGGAGGVGANQFTNPGPFIGYAAGGPGVATNITASPVTYSAGGRGASDNSPGPASGSANTGNAGDGGGDSPTGGGGSAGGSGIVIIRYKFQ